MSPVLCPMGQSLKPQWLSVPEPAIGQGRTSITISTRDYDWHPACVRKWLWVTKRRELNGESWEARVEGCIKLALVALLFGRNVLVHCRQGKHRSGAFGCLLYSVLTGKTLGDALVVYRQRNSRAQGSDIGLVQGIMKDIRLEAFLRQLRQQEWVPVTIRNFQYKCHFFPSQLGATAKQRARPLSSVHRRRSPVRGRSPARGRRPARSRC